MPDLWSQFLRDENATTAIEYALIAAGISVAIVTAVTLIGTEVAALFTKVKEAL
jgi:pilus assembly protein Flp/PilA